MVDHPLIKMIVLSGILTGIIMLTHSVILPIERNLLGDAFGSGVLVYLPLGFWVLVAYYERWSAALYLMPGLAIGLTLYGRPDLSLASQVLTLAVLSTSAPIAFAFLSWTNGHANEPMFERVAWRFIVAAGVLTAVINALGVHIVRYQVLPTATSLPGLVQYVTGGIVGLFACLIALSIGFRIRRYVLRRV